MDKRSIILILLFLFSFSLKPVKCLWVTRWDIQTPGDVKKVIRFADDNDIDIIFLQIYGNGKAFYNSKIVPRALSDFDPLDYSIKLAKNKHIQIHAWLNIAYVWSSRKNPDSPFHLVNRYSQFLLQKNGFYQGYDDMINSNSEGLYISIATEKIRNYYMRVVKEILDNYDVDGIHLDYIRYPGRQFIYGISERTEFYRETYVDIDDEEDSIIFNRNWIEIKKLYPEFIKSRVTLLVKDLGKLTHSYGKLFTAAVIADINRAENSLMQDWIEWVNNDYIDYAVTMSYTANNNIFKKLVATYIKNVKDKEKLIIGIGAYNQSYISVKSKLKYLYSMGIDNVSFFSYSGIVNRDKNYLKKTELLWAF